MKHVSLRARVAMSACAITLLIASQAGAQIRQTKLYIDDGSGNFLQLVVNSLTTSGYTLTFPDAKGVAQTGIVTPTSGTAATGDVLYYNGTTGTFTRLAMGGTGTVLHGQGPNQPPVYGQVSLTTDVSGHLGVSNGGTGATSLAALASALQPDILPSNAAGALTNNGTGTLSWQAALTDPMTTEGDLMYQHLGSTAALAVGSSTFILASTGTDPAWTDPSTITVGNASKIAGNTIPANATGYLYNNGTGTLSWAAALSSSGTNTFTGANTFAPTGAGVTGATVEGTSGGGTADIFDVTGSGGTPNYLSVSSTGAVKVPNLSSSDGASGFTIYNATDATKKAQFDASGITTATTRTYKFPDASGTVALVGTSQNSAANFTSLGINIGAATPNTNLDVSGDVAVRETDNTATTTPLTAVSTSSISNIDFTSEAATFTIDGFANGEPGKQLHIYNKTGQNMTLANLTGTTGDQINTLAGGDVTLNGNGTVNFVYDGAAGSGVWVMQPAMANTIVGLAAVGITYTVESSTQTTAATPAYVADGTLNFAGTAGATYEVRGVLVIGNTGTNQTINLGFDNGSTVSVSLFCAVNKTGSGNFQAAVLCTASGTGNAQSLSLGDNATNFVVVSGIIKLTSAATVHLEWEGKTSAVSLNSNSYLSFTRVQ